MVLFAQAVVHAVAAVQQLLPFVVGLAYNRQRFVPRKDLFVVGDGVRLFAIEYLDVLEPIHDCPYLLLGKLGEAFNLDLEIDTRLDLAYSASITSTFQSTSPWSIRQKLPTTFAW